MDDPSSPPVPSTSRDNKTVEVGVDIPIQPIYSELYPNFPYHQMIATSNPKHRNTIMIRTEKLTEPGAPSSEGRLIYCKNSIEKGLCLRGSGCKYSHPYEYERDPTNALRLDHIISQLNELHILLGLPRRCTEPPRVFVDNYSSRDSSTSRGWQPSEHSNRNRSKTMRSNVLDDTQPKVRKGRSKTRPKGQPKRKERQGNPAMDRSTSRERINRGSSSQLSSLTERLTKFCP